MDIRIPELGESITEGTIQSWIKKVEDSVNTGDLLLELETDKVNLQITAESDGILEEILREAGETVHVGETVGRIRLSSEMKSKSSDAGTREVRPTSIPEIKEGIKEAAYIASPSVRKLARDKGIDLNQIHTEHPLEARRISRDDLQTQITGASDDKSVQANRKENTVNETNDLSRPFERQHMSRRRITIAKRLVEAQRTAAMLTTFNEVDMTAILDIRKRRKQSFLEKYGVGLGFMSFFTKAVVGALKSFPLLNAEIENDDILVKQYYDIGIAVSAKEGLVVPVVRGVDRLSFAEIERQIGQLADKARNNTLALTDLQGGTFTITNGGVFGSLLSTPILNAPQVGILGMHTIQKRPVAIDDDKIEIRPMMYIALSYDHRIVDGSEAVRFLVTLKNMLEDPESLLLEG